MSSTAWLIITFVCMLLGMIAHQLYFGGLYHRRRKISLWSLLYPLVVAPIVFIPLIGVEIENLSFSQQLSIWLLAFQSGFFWATIFTKEKLTSSEDVENKLGRATIFTKEKLTSSKDIENFSKALDKWWKDKFDE